jgi:adenylyltransferase/sulfurtransferase
MDDAQLLRYSRQILLPQVGAEGQQRLLDAHALIIGAGGLGSPIALYLAAAGVGRISIADADKVELSNLQRQIAHTTDDLGRAKSDSASERMHALNPDVRIDPLYERLTAGRLMDRVALADVVLDGSDNFATRFEVNAACVALGTPLVSGAVIRMEGQVSTFLPREPASPCYRCLYREDGEEAETCSESGILAPVAGVVGTIQATEALKVLLGLPTLMGRLLVLDAERMEFRSLRLHRDARCPVCGTAAA